MDIKNTLSDQLGINSVEIMIGDNNDKYNYYEYNSIDGKKWYYFVDINNRTSLYENSDGTSLLIKNNIIML